MAVACDHEQIEVDVKASKMIVWAHPRTTHAYFCDTCRAITFAFRIDGIGGFDWGIEILGVMDMRERVDDWSRTQIDLLKIPLEATRYVRLPV